MNFQAILIHPNKKSVKRLRDVLNQLYNHLDGSASAPSSNADVCVISIRFHFLFYRFMFALELIAFRFVSLFAAVVAVAGTEC